MADWDPNSYLRFEDHRTRPAAELASHVRVAYLLSRRRGRWLLPAPATVLVLTCLISLPLMCLRILDAMTVVE